MSIEQITTDIAGEINVLPRIVRIKTTATHAQVVAANWLAGAVHEGFTFYPTDVVIVSYANNVYDFFRISISNHVITLVDYVPAGSVTLPVVDGDFANFDGTTGKIKDAGYSPSDATKTKVVMAGSAVVANHIALFQDTSGTIDDTAATAINNGPIQAGLSGTSGYLASYPATTLRGSLRLVGANSAGDFITQITNASQAAARVYTIPDGGQAASNFILSDNAATQTIATGSLALSAGSFTASGAITSTAGDITSGSAGDAGTFISFPATTGNGTLIMAAVNAGGAFNTTVSNSVMGQSSVVSIPDPGAATANFLLDTGAANIIAKQQFLGINDVLTFGTGTWTVTRIAQGNYVMRHTAADETSIIAIDVTPIIVAAAAKGFRLDSFDYMYSIGTLALDAHSVTLDRIAYANNVAVSITSIAITGTLETATQANPYLTNVTVNTPAFDITADSKYVMEITVNNSATSAFDFYGVMLRFSQTIA